MVQNAETMIESKVTEQITSGADDVESLAADYLKNMGNGKKNLLCGDFPEAVACFQLACSQQSERFGETSHECAESFHFYGKALLELARMENGVLGNALKGVPETEDESESEAEEPQFEKPNIPAEERQGIRKDVEDAMATDNEEENDQDKSKKSTSDETETPTSTEEDKEVFMETEDSKDTEDSKETGKSDENVGSKDTKESNENGKKEASNGTADKTDAPASSSSNGDAQKEEEGAEAEGEDVDGEGEDPDDISNMQLAWEMLELSKVLYNKKPSETKNKLMVATCHLKLGELGLEVANYSQAIGDFLECLVIRKELLDQSDRSLAETHYQLGLAYAFDKRYENALEHYNNALEVLDSRIDHLNKIIDDKDREQKENEEPHPECTEIGEIKALIPDINSKIEDVLVMKRQESKFVGSPFRNSDGAGSSSSSTTIGFAAPTTPTDKICTVIPIKRKEDIEAEKAEKKKTAENGSTNDITHLVRKKRASDNNEDEIGATNTKKIKTTIENGKSATTNGADKNGVESKKPTENGTTVKA